MRVEFFVILQHDFVTAKQDIDELFQCEWRNKFE